jgi:hypothetical protein
VPGVYLRNAHELSVFRVVAEIRGSDTQDERQHLPLAVEVLPPASEPKWYSVKNLAPDDWGGSGRVSITFTDSSGKTWRRLASGQLLDPMRKAWAARGSLVPDR